MKKVLVGIVILFSSVYAKDLVSDGLVQYNNKNYIQAKQLWNKACDMGIASGCRKYSILNKQEY